MHPVRMVRYILVLVCIGVLSAGCETSAMTKDTADQPGPTTEKSAPQATTYVYECEDGSTFVARIEGEIAWLFLRTGTVSLPHIPRGSGAKYTDGEITFWTKGEEAMI